MKMRERMFTRGPWLMASKASSVVGWPVVAPHAEGRVVCSLNYADPKAFGGRQPGDGAFNAESRANGLLIAAAPELYEALDALCNGIGEKLWDNARAALAKARGDTAEPPITTAKEQESD